MKTTNDGFAMIEEIRELYAYHGWANGRMLDAAAALTPQELTRDLGSSFPSVRDTLRHMLGAEWIWLSRWLGASPTAWPDWKLDTLEEIRARWVEVERERAAFLDALTPDALGRVVAYRTMAGSPHENALWQLLRHVVNHATYHRGQVTTMLRQLGHPVLATDLVLFFRERATTPSQPAVQG